MARTYYNVKRGMVFWYEPPKSETKTSVQKGRRPWLVVSNDMGNISSPTCNIVPTTTECKTNLPVHVETWFNGQKNTILCEQSLTVDQNSLKEYICVLSDDTMNKIDEALAIQFNIRPTCPEYNMDNIVSKLEDLIGKIIKNKVESQNKVIIPYEKLEDSALRLGQMIEDLVGVSSSTKTNPDQTTFQPEISPVENTHNHVQVADGRKTDAKPTATKRGKWTTELRCQYLRDCDVLSPEQVRLKYGFSTVGTVFSTKYNCKNVLKELGVDYKNENVTRG